MDNTEEHYEVEYVFGKKTEKTGEINYAVKWLGYDKKQHTWEPLSSFSDASLLLISRFERLLSYRNYYKFMVKKPEKVKACKGPDEPLRVHVRGRLFQTQQKEAEIINIELETQEVCSKSDLAQVKDQEPDVQIVAVNQKPIRQTDFKDINRFRQEKVSHLTDFNKFNQLRSLGNALNPILKNTPSLIKSKFKLEKDYLNEIIFEQRQKEKEANLCEVSEIKDKREPGQTLKVISETSQTETAQPQEYVFLDLYFKPRVLEAKVLIEMISSHHLYQNSLWFKCKSDSDEELYVDFDKLQQNYSTLLLDYLSECKLVMLK